MNKSGAGANKASLAQRSKYQFEADSEDDEMENEIDCKSLSILLGLRFKDIQDTDICNPYSEPRCPARLSKDTEPRSESDGRRSR